MAEVSINSIQKLQAAVNKSHSSNINLYIGQGFPKLKFRIKFSKLMLVEPISGPSK